MTFWRVRPPAQFLAEDDETFEETEIVQEFLNDLGKLIVFLNGYDDIDGLSIWLSKAKGFSGKVFGPGERSNWCDFGD